MSERGGRRTARDLQREETRERVFEAALDVFREQGMAQARIEDIAQAAEVSRGTFYFHFPRREDVMLELLDRSQQRSDTAKQFVHHIQPDHYEREQLHQAFEGNRQHQAVVVFR